MAEVAPTYIFAGGGTGGHLTPAIAVARRIDEIQPGANIVFLCTDRPTDERFLGPAGYGMVPQPVRPIPSSPVRWPGFYLRWRRSLGLARRVCRDVKPAAVLGLGGYAAGPMVRVAAAAGVRTGLLNPDAVPGKANLYLARRTDAVFTQFEQTAERFDAAVRAKVNVVGCPIRASLIGGDRAEAMAELGLRPDLRCLAVMGGSLGAETVNQAVLAAAAVAAEHADRWQVLHVTGPGKSGRARDTYVRAGVGAVVVEFCDRMGLLYAVADLLIGRAGANTIAELTATGTPAVLMPYPFHADDHQRHNAADSLAAGAAVLVDDAAETAVNAARLGEAIGPLLADPGKLSAMATAAESLARPAAADAVARWMIGSS